MKVIIILILVLIFFLIFNKIFLGINWSIYSDIKNNLVFDGQNNKVVMNNLNVSNLKTITTDTNEIKLGDFRIRQDNNDLVIETGSIKSPQIIFRINKYGTIKQN